MTKRSISDLAVRTGLSERTIRQYRLNYRQHGTLYPPKAKRGPEPKMTEEMEKVENNGDMRSIY